MKYDTYHLALYGERTWSLAEKGAGRSKSLQTGMDCCCFCPQVTLTSKGTYLIEPIMPYVTDSGHANVQSLPFGGMKLCVRIKQEIEGKEKG